MIFMLHLLAMLTILKALHLHTACSDYVNNYDQKIHWHAPKNNFVTGMHSVHSNWNEDRRWKFCYGGGSGITKVDPCSWTTVNRWDSKIDFTCPTGRAVAGFEAEQNNYYEDRVWKIQCCTVRGARMSGGVWGGYSNLDGTLEQRCGKNYLVTGMRSEHSNWHEDRKWSIRCSNLDDTPAPTPNPTAKPTPNPTAKPTVMPTPLPTLAPTSSPTLAPTPAPTSSPTPAPTMSPTRSPTPAPTRSPTPAPTEEPSTSAPTPSPTDSPTLSPTPSPSDLPTLSPTPSPTDLPTLSPTPSPTCKAKRMWTEATASENCDVNKFPSKKFGVEACQSRLQTTLEDSLANQLYVKCKSRCVYGYSDLLSNEKSAFFYNKKAGCYKYRSKKSCLKDKVYNKQVKVAKELC